MFFQSLPKTPTQTDRRVTLPPANNNSDNENNARQTNPAPIPPANKITGENVISPTNEPIANPNNATPVANEPAPAAPNEKLQGMLTCDQSCQRVGYRAGYCGKWIENNDQTITECQTDEFVFDPYYYDSLGLTDCVHTGDPLDKIKTVCCCKGKPQNEPNCPAIKRPTEPMACIEQPGYLKDPATGKCCWYEATCYGPENWVQFNTKSECLEN